MNLRSFLRKVHILSSLMSLYKRYNLKIADSLIDWTAKDEDNEDISVWEDNWDDDDVEDDFNQQLRYLNLFNKRFT